MKIKHLTLVALAMSFALTSCNKDEQPSGNESVESYMTLELTGPKGAFTKTLAEADGTEVGTAVENKISSVKILLCNTGSHTVAYSYDISDGLIETSNGAKTLPVKTVTGTYEVYVIANAGSVAPAVGTDVSGQTITSVTEALMKSAYAHDNKFIMFNENNTSAVTATSITISAENDYDHPAVCDPIKLDRLAVKIRPTTAETVDVTGVTGELSAITAMNLVGFRLLNGATTTNLMQHWTAATNEAGTFGWKNTLVSPVIAIADYYNKLADFRTIEKTTNTDGTEKYNTVKDTYDAIAAYAGETDPIYCMENNPTWNGTAVLAALKGNTTGLVFKFQATVTGSDEKAGANCFYAYNGKYYPTLAALQTANPSAFLKAAPEGTAAEQLAAAEAELAAATDEAGISAFRTKYLIKVYKGGVVYYTYYIKDKNYEQTDTEGTDGNYYSVMRNTIYGLTVKALQRIGTDIPGGWNPETDPEDPVDTKDVYMVVEAQVNPWVLSNEEIALK